MSDSAQRYLVTICQHRSCMRSGSDQVLAKFQEHQSINVMISGCECQGQCGSGPTVRVMPGDTWYCRVQPEDVDTIVDEHLNGGKPVERLLHPRIHQTHSAYANLAAQYQAFTQED
ncbi:MAG: (2Fe-2S) ferredoxin domain-containing protein [Leptolyngbya sp. SIO1E4]|nr:(2Fe-2S) ferredoxin domain-containing protein [Leptolyngbya sp. SIO1E4]